MGGYFILHEKNNTKLFEEMFKDLIKYNVFVMLLVLNYIIVRIIISWVFLTSEFAGSMMVPV